MSRKIRRQDVAGFALSFLDVLCCGLGSAVLLLLVVKHGPADAEWDSQAYIAEQLVRLQSLVDEKKLEKDDLTEQYVATEHALMMAVDKRQSESKTQRARMTEFLRLLEQLNSERAVLNESSVNLKQLQLELEIQLKSVEEVDQQLGQIQQIAGIKIEDSRVAILLDSSASMLDRSLVEIIRLRVSDENFQREAKKWVVARKTAKWAHAKIKDGGQFQLLMFNENVHDVEGNVFKTGNALDWAVKGDEGISDDQIHGSLDQALPSGATNLKESLLAVASLDPQPNQILLITDGLPTLPGDTSLRRLRKCPSVRKGTTPILSPSCRLSVFLDAAKVAERQLRRIRIDVVLLPLDGDANSVFAYWILAAQTGGRLLAPAEGWPFF